MPNNAHSASPNWIIFENPGEIDRRLITTMGVNVKDGDSPIGYFGTGLKYAIATWMRLGVQVEIHSGTSRFEFTTSKQVIRGKEFELISMLEHGQAEDAPQELELAFTTDLGRNWEPWMAYRELWSNCKDESGQVREAPVLPEPEAGLTRICIRGADATSAHAGTAFWLLDTRQRLVCKMPGLEVYAGSSQAGFYRGIRVTAFDPPAMFTYNLLEEQILTEDRTLSAYSFQLAISKIVKQQCSDYDFLDQVLLPQKDSMEQQLYWQNASWIKPSDDFIARVERARDLDPLQASRNAIAACKEYLTKQVRPTIPMTSLQAQAVVKAVDFLERVGWKITYPIFVVETLGDKQIHALADLDHKQILLSSIIFTQGVKYLASTLLEEQWHLEHGHVDESRAFQTFLLDQLVTMGERLLGKPV